MTTWFVRDCGAHLDVDQGDRWCSKWRSTIRGVNLWFVPPLSRTSNVINFSDRMQVGTLPALDDKYLT